MIKLWPNDCWSSRGPTWSLHQWPIRDECLWNFENPTTEGRENNTLHLTPVLALGAVKLFMFKIVNVDFFVKVPEAILWGFLAGLKGNRMGVIFLKSVLFFNLWSFQLWADSFMLVQELFGFFRDFSMGSFKLKHLLRSFIVMIQSFFKFRS